MHVNVQLSTLVDRDHFHRSTSNYIFMWIVSGENMLLATRPTCVNGIKTKLSDRCITNLTLFQGRRSPAVNTLNSEFGGRGSNLAVVSLD